MSHPFRTFIEAGYVLLAKEEWLEIEKALTYKEVKPNQLVLEQGQVCRYLYFVEEGLLRYFILKDGEEVTKFFTEAPYLFTSQVSFNNRKPANENIKTIEHCKIWAMHYDDAYRLLQLPGWETFIRKITQEVQYYTEVILEEIQTQTAEERYRFMLNDNPALLQRIPLKYLASYFGIAAPSLSRIRKNIFKGGS